MPRERGSLCASRCDVDRPRFCPARGLTLAEWGFSTINELKSLLKKISIFLGESHSALLDPLRPAFRSRSFEGLGVAEAFFFFFFPSFPLCSSYLFHTCYNTHGIQPCHPTNRSSLFFPCSCSKNLAQLVWERKKPIPTLQKHAF